MNLGRALVLSGDIEAGLESNQKAARHAAPRCLPSNPSNAGYRRLLAISYQNDGDYRVILHDTSGALESFRKKLVLDEQSFADDPVNAQSRGDLGYTCERIGTLLALSGEHAEARSYYRRALDLYEQLSADSPQDVYLRYPLDHRPRRNRRDAGEARRADRRAG